MIGLNCSRDAIVPVREVTPSAHSARSRKMPGWIVPVREIFCKQAGILVGFFSGFVSLVVVSEFLIVLFQLLHFGFQIFHPEKLKKKN